GTLGMGWAGFFAGSRAKATAPRGFLLCVTTRRCGARTLRIRRAETRLPGRGEAGGARQVRGERTWRRLANPREPWRAPIRRLRFARRRARCENPASGGLP